MTWDETFQTWEHYEVRRQPTVVLVDAAGETLGQWSGLSQDMVDLVEAS